MTLLKRVFAPAIRILLGGSWREEDEEEARTRGRGNSLARGVLPAGGFDTLAARLVHDVFLDQEAVRNLLLQERGESDEEGKLVAGGKQALLCGRRTTSLGGRISTSLCAGGSQHRYDERDEV